MKRARAAPRLKAYLRDFFVYIGVSVVFMTTAVMVGTSLATQASVVACIAFVLLYEPACIAIAGGTVGHLTQNLRIVHSSDLGRVSFLRAVCRTLVKGILGLWVFIAVYFTRRCQALKILLPALSSFRAIRRWRQQPASLPRSRGGRRPDEITD